MFVIIKINGMFHAPHARCFWMFYLVFIPTFALPCLIFIINYLQDLTFFTLF
ncbi:MAG: hypothetical protein NZ455_13355 [Bacteroidia bacterium]|nr:hypothetical protein [Bacteroidia bacterium]MDW8347721.1 hypothetical protein [Bacteroidia bacterium]